MDNKPNQHYVWQKYLEPWIKDGKIACLRNKKDVFQTNPRNIASERYFYKINKLTYNDCQLIRKIFIDNRPEFMKNLLEGWVKPIENFLILCDNYAKKVEMRDPIEDYKEIALKNMLENLYMNVEIAGISGLSRAQTGDISFLSESNNENKMDFILYLSFQYFRTKKIKQSVKKSLGKHVYLFSDFDDAFNLIALINSTTFGNTLYNLINNNEFF